MTEEQIDQLNRQRDALLALIGLLQLSNALEPWIEQRLDSIAETLREPS